jgi:hypothetical protein
MRWNRFRIGGVAFERKDMPQDEWITDPQDGRLTGLPEWVPRPGETAVIHWSLDSGPVETTVKAVRIINDEALEVDTDFDIERLLFINRNLVNSIGNRYRHPGLI